MNSMLRRALWCSLGAGTALLGVFVIPSFSPHARAATVAAIGQGKPGFEAPEAAYATGVSSHGDHVISDPSCSFSDLVVDPSTGASVRVVTPIVVWFDDQTRYLGMEFKSLIVDAQSSQVAKWVRTGIDPSIYSDDPNAPEAPQTYEIVVSPAPGLTWGEIQKHSQVLVDVVRVK